MSDPSPIVHIRSLVHQHTNQSAPVLHCERWELEAGKSVLLTGRSGSGKSTLLNLLGGFLKPTKGSITVHGEEITALSASATDAFRAQHLGIVLQRPHLLPQLSVAMNLSIAGMFASPSHQIPSDEEIQKLCSGLEIAHLLDRSPHELSSGEAQRVTIARALAGKPSLVLADEPTSALDDVSRDAFLELLFNAKAEHDLTLIVASHDRDIAPLFDQRVEIERFKSGESQ